MRELAIRTIASSTESAYIQHHHPSPAAPAAQVTEDITSLVAEFAHRLALGRPVPDRTSALLRDDLGPQAYTELVITCLHYRCVASIVALFDVELEGRPGQGGRR